MVIAPGLRFEFITVGFVGIHPEAQAFTSHPPGISAGPPARPLGDAEALDLNPANDPYPFHTIVQSILRN